MSQDPHTPIDITSDTRFVRPIPGVVFRYNGSDVDLRKIAPARAMKLAADEKCKFLKLADATPAATPAAAQAPPEPNTPSPGGDNKGAGDTGSGKTTEPKEPKANR